MQCEIKEVVPANTNPESEVTACLSVMIEANADSLLNVAAVCDQHRGTVAGHVQLGTAAVLEKKLKYFGRVSLLRLLMLPLCSQIS